MTTSSPAEGETLLSPEQRRRLGEVYRLILSWGQDDKKMEQNPTKPLSAQVPSQPVAALDTSFSEDISKGGADG